MNILAFSIAFALWLTILIIVRLRIDLTFSYLRTESEITLKIKTLFTKLTIKIEIPREMLATGIENILNIIIRDVTGKEVVPDDKKYRGKRYLFLRHLTGEVYRNFLSSWPKFLLLKNKVLKLKTIFYKKVEVYSFDFRIEFGRGDAAETGIMVGVIWALLGQMKARIYRSVTVKGDDIRYELVPRFDDEVLLCEINCIFQLKISHIIFTALKFLTILLKIRRIGNNG